MTLVVISLECLILQMLRQKFKGVPIIEIGRPLTFLLNSGTKSKFPIEQENVPGSTEERITHWTVVIVLHVVERADTPNPKPTSSVQRRNRLKNLVGIYLWLKICGMHVLQVIWRWRSIISASRLHHKIITWILATIYKVMATCTCCRLSKWQSLAKCQVFIYTPRIPKLCKGLRLVIKIKKSALKMLISKVIMDSNQQINCTNGLLGRFHTN